MNASGDLSSRKHLLVRAAPFAPLALVGCLFAWWAWETGAYFGRVFYPGEVGVLILLGILVMTTRLSSGSDRRAMAIAIFSLLALAVWILASLLWTPTPEAAVIDTHKVLLYVALFAIGALLVRLLGERRDLALVPLGAAGLLVGAATVIALATGSDVASFLHEDATLRFPLGYRNADAAFWLICAWPLVALAVSGRFRWGLRALMLGGVTMLIELTILSQSRGSIPAAVAALLVMLVSSRKGLKIAGFVALASLPVLPALPALLHVYQHGAANPSTIPLLRDAARAIALSTAGSLALCAIYLRGVEPRVHPRQATVARLSRAGAAVALIGAVAISVLLTAHYGGPVSFVSQRLSQLNQGSQDLRGQGTRFGLNVSSKRGDMWRVAFDEWKRHPIRGGGAGSWQLEYLRHREGRTPAHDPHSVEMLMLSEFGLPGALLFISFLLAAGIGAWRGHRGNTAALTLSFGALAVATQWFVQASYDWLFLYPGVTAPVVFLLGAAAAPAAAQAPVPAAGRRASALRWLALALLSVLAVAAGALYLSARYADRGASLAQSNPQAAYRDFDRAASIDPFAVEPLLLKATTALEAGDRATALPAIRATLGRESSNFDAHYLLGMALLRSRPANAERELLVAHQLDPLYPLHAPLARSREALGRARARARAACCTPGR